MREHLLCILRDVRSINLGSDCTRVQQIAKQIEVEVEAALKTLQDTWTTKS